MMQLFTDRLLLSIENMDDQHRVIFETVEKFQAACNKGEPAVKIREIFGIMRKYLEDHFKEEEEYMIKYDYPDYEAHRDSHNVFTRKLNLIDNTIKSDYMSLAKLAEINEYLSETFVTHLSEIDSNLAEFLRDKL